MQRPFSPYRPPVNPLYNLGASLQFLQFAKQQLQGMHSLIDARQIPVAKSEDFFPQALGLARTVEDTSYARTLRRYGTAKNGLIIAASLTLAIAVIIYGLSWFGPTSEAIHAAIKPLMADFVLFSTTISIVAGALFIGLMAGHFYIRALEKSLQGKALSTLWARILHRWMPELTKNHDIANTDPTAIAALVAVQARIQDVDLELQ